MLLPPRDESGLNLQVALVTIPISLASDEISFIESDRQLGWFRNIANLPTARSRVRHAWLWFVTIASILLCILFFIGSLCVFEKAPDDIEHQHIWGRLKDIGPAIAGSWVLCAALLAITAAGITALAALSDSEDHTKAREKAIKRVCVGEIKAFWDMCNRLELRTKLRNHISWLKTNQLSPEKLRPFRRNVGEDWFVFFRVDPEALGALSDEISSLYISLSVRCRGLSARLNWLNECHWDPEQISFWIDYHSDTLEVLDSLYNPSESLLARLGVKIDLDKFQF
jgi:hypothetical protein